VHLKNLNAPVLNVLSAGTNLPNYTA